MRKSVLTIVFMAICPLLIPALMASAQSGAVIPQGGAGHTNQASCLILKRMGPADEVTSHMYSFGIRGKQFQYVEGKFPEGSPFHGRLTDHDVRNLQGRGQEVLILEPHYTSEDLKEARAECKGMTGETPNKTSEINAIPQPMNNAQSGIAPIPPPSTAQATVAIDSTPAGADIEIDGAFVGNTPSTISVDPGSHQVVVKKKGFNDWSKTLNVTGGTIHLNAELEKSISQPPTPVPPPPPPTN
ncbi:MAG: PEGA domain-containing protein [Terracidiphilus sp.]